MTANNRADLQARVDEFHARFDAKIAEVVAGLQEIKIEWYCDEAKPHRRVESGPFVAYQTGDDDYYQTHQYSLHGSLEVLVQAVNAQRPKHIAQSNSHDRELKRERILYQDGSSFIAWIEHTPQFLPDLKERVGAIFHACENKFDALPPEKQRIVRAYAILTGELLPEWKKDNYLQNLGEALGEVADRQNVVAAAELTVKSDADKEQEERKFRDFLDKARSKGTRLPDLS